MDAQPIINIATSTPMLQIAAVILGIFILYKVVEAVIKLVFAVLQVLMVIAAAFGFIYMLPTIIKFIGQASQTTAALP